MRNIKLIKGSVELLSESLLKVKDIQNHKAIQIHIILSILLILFPWKAKGQVLDSVAFGNVKMQAGLYELNTLGIDKIELKSEKAFPFKEFEEKGKENFTEGVWTQLTGLPTQTLIESAWIFPNYIKFSGREISVRIPVIVNGYYESSRNRVKDEQGNKTLKTEENVVLLLEKGAWGWFINQSDTLGQFTITKRNTNHSNEYWAGLVGNNLRWLDDKLKKYGAMETATDFLIEGSLNGKNFMSVYSGQYFRCAMIRDQQTVGIWQNTPYAIMLSKKNKITPYLLLPADATEKDQMEIILILGLGHTLARNMMGI